MKTYLLTYTGDANIRNDITNFIDSRPEILNWFSPNQNMILLVSNFSIFDIQSLFTTHHAGFFFVITEVDVNKTGGYMSKGFWEFIKHPKSSGKWENQLQDSVGGGRQGNGLLDNLTDYNKS